MELLGQIIFVAALALLAIFLVGCTGAFDGYANKRPEQHYAQPEYEYEETPCDHRFIPSKYDGIIVSDLPASLQTDPITECWEARPGVKLYTYRVAIMVDKEGRIWIKGVCSCICDNGEANGGVELIRLAGGYALNLASLDFQLPLTDNNRIDDWHKEVWHCEPVLRTYGDFIPESKPQIQSCTPTHLLN